jgi:uncharacterized protein YndB with AHSA1/START domain
VAYEKARGRRVGGQTADAGFQIGVSRTFAVTPDEAWRFMTSPQGMRLWLGHVQSLELAPGTGYRTAQGTTGEIRTKASGMQRHWAQVLGGISGALRAVR